ncbi:Dihydrofolate reductase [Bacillus siamensis]|nr:Dihydrofolate reductase [Bacillus siamensis]
MKHSCHNVYLWIVDSDDEKAHLYFLRLNDNWRVIEKDYRKADAKNTFLNY